MYLYNSKDVKVGIDYGVVVIFDVIIGFLDLLKVFSFG